MARHYWGDEWPHWDDLYKAEHYFSKFYKKCTKNYPITKEKYGTIRFEGTYLWIKGEQDCRIFREAIKRTIKKFPNVTVEIVNTACYVLNDEYFNGWCNGVAFALNGAMWISEDRPNGV